MLHVQPEPSIPRCFPRRAGQAVVVKAPEYLNGPRYHLVEFQPWDGGPTTVVRMNARAAMIQLAPPELVTTAVVAAAAAASAGAEIAAAAAAAAAAEQEEEGVVSSKRGVPTRKSARNMERKSYADLGGAAAGDGRGRSVEREKDAGDRVGMDEEEEAEWEEEKVEEAGEQGGEREGEKTADDEEKEDEEKETEQEGEEETAQTEVQRTAKRKRSRKRNKSEEGPSLIPAGTKVIMTQEFVMRRGDKRIVVKPPGGSVGAKELLGRTVRNR